MSIIYEMPLNDLIRACLRLEQLFEALTHAQKSRNAGSTRDALQHLLNILQITDRADLRTKLLQQVQLHMESLTPLKAQSHVDQRALNKVLEALQHHADTLHHQHGKLGQSLRDNPFLSHLQLRCQQPSNVHYLNDPHFQLWMQLKTEKRRDMLNAWESALQPLHAMVTRILQLLRAQPHTQEVRTERGFFQTGLDAQHNYQLIRVQLPLAAHVFPEISASRYRLAIHLMQFEGDQKAVAAPKDLKMSLSFCAPFIERKTLPTDKTE